MPSEWSDAQPGKAKAKGNPQRTRPTEVENDDATMEDAKMAVVQRFYMGSAATSPRAILPSISSEAFMFIKNIFRKKRPMV